MNASQKVFASHSEGKTETKASQKVLESTLPKPKTRINPRWNQPRR
ncbi:hypothetical protein [Cytobacillus kochii]|nr:hypothetical protein [Cytobacillus kochii]MCM3323616.1 hypothetical protein [Cytobacillus kochii]MCM3346203.1 hypothetical protein [Cytobacillus kochii]